MELREAEMSMTGIQGTGRRLDYIAGRAAFDKPITLQARKPVRLGALVCITVLVLAYINLVPFDYHPVPFEQAVERFRHLPWLRIIESDRSRWFSNVLQFTPFGFLACGALGRRSRIFGVLAAGVLGTTLATGLEFAQIWVPERTVALDDVFAEVVGTAAGIVAWLAGGKRLIQTIRTAISAGPNSVVAALYIYLGIYAFVFLYPFDLVVSVDEIGARLADANAIIWPKISGLSRYSVAYAVLKIALMIPAGAAVNLVWRRGPASAVAAAISFAWLIEIVHLFEKSAAANPVNIATAAAGAAIGHRLIGPLRRMTQLDRAVRIVAWAAIPFYLAALMVARNWRFGLADASEVAETLRSLHWIPLYYHYFAPSNENAFWSIVSIGASFAPVGILLWGIGLKPGTTSSRMPLPVTAVLAAALCGAAEAGRLLTAGLRPDPTNILIAAGAAVLAQRICEWGASVFPKLLQPQLAPVKRFLR